jgi:hypothetical protein
MGQELSTSCPDFSNKEYMPQVSVMYEIDQRGHRDADKEAAISKAAGLRPYKTNLVFKSDPDDMPPMGSGKLRAYTLVKFYYKDEASAKKLMDILKPFGEVRDLGKQ